MPLPARGVKFVRTPLADSLQLNVHHPDSHHTRSAAARERDEWDAVIRQFHQAVNLTAEQLEDFLATRESQTVARTKEGARLATGQLAGGLIVAILDKERVDYTEADISQMRRGGGYIHPPFAPGGPPGGIEHSPWRYSLMNSGCDPLKMV